MPIRIEIHPRTDISIPDSRGRVLLAKAIKHFPKITNIRVVDVYTLDGDFSREQTEALAEALTQQVTQEAVVLPPPDWLSPVPPPLKGGAKKTAPPLRGGGERKRAGGDSCWAIEIGFLPGVTDNIATTVKDMIRDRFGNITVEVFSSKLLLLEGALDTRTLEAFAATQHNPLIQRCHMQSADTPMPIVLPRVKLAAHSSADAVELKLDDAGLSELSAKGIPNADGSRRGPLGLSLDYLKAIRTYFEQTEKRAPRDIELETLAQSWSEHCKHTIFASAIDEVKDGIYKHYIRRATEEIRKRRGNNDICVSVFKDNAGAIVFDENWLVTDKVETHNSPSALDPFGGAITGIVGVNRDALGFGLGAKPVLNRYGFCFADPESNPEYYRAPGKKNKMLSPRTIMEGVIQGVNVGGNCSGIPTPQGFLMFDDRYAGKPLVFVGTVGLIPRTLGGKPSHVKSAKAGDAIVMIGGRVGRDGIHGATFSSVALDEGSPSTAVQIGDPITQKKFIDAIVRDARELGWYNAITDNGAGGLSSSVGEMAEGSGGFELHLDKVPLKYPGMAPWEIWISESQERMTLAVPPQHLKDFIALMARRGVEATALGHFTDDGRARILWQGTEIMNMAMDFLHNGNPPKFLHSNPTPATTLLRRTENGERRTPPSLPSMLSRLNLCSREFLATQYDHEVQGTSLLKPLQGKGRVFAEATAIKPVFDSPKAVVTAQGLAPRYSDLDCYHMAAASIDIAVRNAIAAGCTLDHLAILDNFCWCDAENPYRLWQLKRAGEACYDVAVAYGTPYISGKDSMFNDFKGYDADNNPIMISAPPTLLVSALGVVNEATKLVSLDAKVAGDLIYVLGITRAELGGSEYADHIGVEGGQVPVLRVSETEPLYRLYAEAVDKELLASSMAITLGGLGVATAKMLIAEQLGAEIDLTHLPTEGTLTLEEKLYSESLGRFLVTVAPTHKQAFEKHFASVPHGCIGTLTQEATLRLAGKTHSIHALEEAYKTPLSLF